MKRYISELKSIYRGQEIWLKTDNDRQRLRILEISDFEIICEHLFYESIGKRTGYAEISIKDSNFHNIQF